MKSVEVLMEKDLRDYDISNAVRVDDSDPKFIIIHKKDGTYTAINKDNIVSYRLYYGNQE